MEKITPSAVASKIVAEDEICWLVECEEPGCKRSINVPKRTKAPDGTVTEYAAPRAMKCVPCGFSQRLGG